MKNRNILVLSDYAAPYSGNFVESIREFGEKVVLEGGGSIYYWFNAAAKNAEWTKLIPNVGFLDDNFIGSVNELVRFVRKKDITVLYTHFCGAKIMAAVQVTRILCPNLRVVEHFHNHFGASRNPIKNILKRLIYQADLYIGCSKGVSDSLPYATNKASYVDNGLYFPRLDKFKKINLVPKGDFAILMFGHTYERKGVDIAIRAIQKLKNPHIRLLISLSAKRDEFEAKMRNDFGEIPDFVEILEPRNDIGTYYRNVDLFISPSREEGLCYSPLEAMYCGTPCVCSDIDGHARDIPDLLLCKLEDVNDLARQIQNIYESKSQFNAAKVKQFLRQNYSVKRWAEGILEVINVYLGQSRV